MTLALITTNPRTVVMTYNDIPNPLLLPNGNQVHGIAAAPWVSQDGDFSLVAVIAFAVPAGQITTGEPSYALNSSEVVVETYATIAAPPTPPTPVTSMQLVSASTPALNGTYSIDSRSQQKVQAISLYAQINGKFPAGQSAQAWPDSSGTAHAFPTVAAWQAFATAMGDFVAALDLGQTPEQSVFIL